MSAKLQNINVNIYIYAQYHRAPPPVGAGSEGLMSESLSRFFKRFVQTEWLIRQMSVHKNGIMKH